MVNIDPLDEASKNAADEGFPLYAWVRMNSYELYAELIHTANRLVYAETRQFLAEQKFADLNAVLMNPPDESSAAIVTAPLRQRVAELESELEAMTHNRDEWRANCNENAEYIERHSREQMGYQDDAEALPAWKLAYAELERELERELGYAQRLEYIIEDLTIANTKLEQELEHVQSAMASEYEMDMLTAIKERNQLREQVKALTFTVNMFRDSRGEQP